MPLKTEDLAPPAVDDPRGAGLAASALPITLAGLLPAVALVFALKREVWTRFTAVVIFAGLAGVSIAALLRFVLGSIDANFWGVAGGLTLGVLAAGLSMLGLGSLFGRVGLVLGALTALLLGNPLSGLTSCTGDAARRLGSVGAMAAAGRQRDAAAVDGVLRRRRGHAADRGPDLLVADRRGADRRRGAATAGSLSRVTYYRTAWDSTTVTRCARCATRSILRSAPTN